LAEKMAIVCCDRLLLAHSANFIKLIFMVVEIFWRGCFAPPRLLRQGATAQLCPCELPHWTWRMRVANFAIKMAH